MKKRLLISSALMTAVLACALGTGTYAWYTATAGTLDKTATATVNNIATIANPYSIGGLKFTPVIEDENLPAAGLLLTDNIGDVYYIPSAGKAKVKDDAASAQTDDKKTGTYTVHIVAEITGGTASLAEALAALGETEYTVTVVGSKGIKVGDSAANAYSNEGFSYTFKASDFTGSVTADQTFYVAADGEQITETISNGTVVASVA